MSLWDWNNSGAIVTGGASGLGAATAAKLAVDGQAVVIFDQDERRGRAHATDIGGHFVAVDVADPLSVAQALKAAMALVDSIRILVNCAGIGSAAKTVSRGTAHDPALFERVIRVNLLGSFNCASQVAAAMAAFCSAASVRYCWTSTYFSRYEAMKEVRSSGRAITAAAMASASASPTVAFK